MVSRDGDIGRLDERTAAAVRTALDRILLSDAFRAAPQLSAFLNFIVERAIEGRSGELKAYTVAVEAFGRPADFDPQTDPIVRVEAGRLRKALGQYYAEEGERDRVRISMPVGAYVPAFEIDQEYTPTQLVRQPDAEIQSVAAIEPMAEPAPAPVSAPAGRPERNKAKPLGWIIPAFLALLLVLGVFAVWYGAGPPPERPVTAQTDADTVKGSSPIPSQLPVIAVVSTDFPNEPGNAELARRFTALLVDTMARFDDLVVVKAPLEQGARVDGADYVVELSAARFGERSESSARLRAVKDGRIVWSTSSDRPIEQFAEDPQLPELARRLAIRLVEPFGVIYSDYRQSASPAMRCIVQAMDYRRTMKPEDHRNARACLEALLDRDPNFHPAWSQLALLTLDEATSELNPRPGVPLDRALSAALNAVRLAPSSARAQQVMMDVLFARRQTAEAFASGQEALSRNPYDPDIMADLGARHIQLGRPEDGMPLLNRAIGLSSARPPWYDFFAFLGARLLDDDKASANYASRLLADEGPLSLLGRAMYLARTGDNVGFAAAVTRLKEVAPLFGIDPRLFLAGKGFGPRVIELVMVDLGPGLVDQLKPR